MMKFHFTYPKNIGYVLQCYIYAMFACSQAAISQHSNLKIPDSLANKGYEYFIEKVDDDDIPKELAKIYGDVYLSKATKAQNWDQAVNAWKNIIHRSEKGLKLVYADSMIAAATSSKNNTILGKAHIYKGAIYFHLNRYQNALREYLAADDYIIQAGDGYYTNQLKFLIGQTKCYLGYYEEAIALLRECVDYYQKDGGKPYLSSLHSLGICYQRTNQLDHASATNNLGIAEAKNSLDTDAIMYFVNSEAINQFLRGKYRTSLQNLHKSYATFLKTGDIVNQSNTLFYIGKNYLALNEEEKAISYLKKVDEAFLADEFIRPELREAYEILKRYHHKQGNTHAELYYAGQLGKVDRYLLKNFTYLSRKIHKEYDEKKVRATNFEQQSTLKTIIIITLIALILIIAYALYLRYKHGTDMRLKKQKVSKYREEKEKPKTNVVAANDKLSDINLAIVRSVLQQAEELKENKKFLQKDLTAATLATMFNSNSSYVSRIINHHKGCKVMEYIYELKIDYITDLLQAQPKYRHYTNQALADEAGFSTVQQFVKSFKKRVGVAPRFFIEQIQEKKIEQVQKEASTSMI